MIAKLKDQELHQSQSEVRTVDTQCGSSMNSFQDMDGKIMKNPILVIRQNIQTMI